MGAIEADALGELQPARDAAGAGRIAVVIDQPPAPFATQLGGGQARDQRRVLGRDVGLVVVAVERPGLHLRARAAPVVQHPVERMQVVVALGADAAQRRLQLVRRQRLVSVGHRASSMPSSATSQPCGTHVRALGAVVEQHGIAVVDMQQDLPLHAERREGGDRALRPGEAHVAHAAAGLGADAEPDHLVIVPQRAVEHTSSAPRSRSASAGVMAAQPGMKNSVCAPSEMAAPTVVPSCTIGGASPGRSR